MIMRCWFRSLLVVALVLLAAGVAGATDVIPYPTPGTLNPVTYTFTAASTGDITAYFAGSTASFDNRLGLMVNGVLTGAGFGLDNHTSAIGDSFNLGHANAGDTLVFVLHNLTFGGENVFSDRSMNAAYDGLAAGTNHVYSTPFTQNPPRDSIPAGTFVSFEDLRACCGSDFNYNDEDFVFVNVATRQSVPEPATLTLVGLGLGGIAVRRWRRRATGGR